MWPVFRCVIHGSIVSKEANSDGAKCISFARLVQHVFIIKKD